MKDKKHYINSYISDPRHNLTISVIGVGGTGSFLLSKLARLNIALKEILEYPGIHVQAYDGDTIGEHNYMRSTFSSSDKGLFKATTAISRINRHYGTKWKGIDEFYSIPKHQVSNITIFCIDTLDERKSIYEGLRKEKKGYHFTESFYIVDVGNEKGFGQVLLSTVHDDNKTIHHVDGYDVIINLKPLWELFPDTKQDDSPSCSSVESLSKQGVFINEHMAILAAEMIKDIITLPLVDYNAIFTNLDEKSSNKTFLV